MSCCVTVQFSRTTVLSVEPERAFHASLNVDFHVESFAGTGEQIVGGVTGGEMRHGDTVTWRARHFGIWWRMTSEISELDAPHMFVDRQVKGPFKRFLHRHCFTPVTGGTRLVDEVTFEAPFGPLGLLVERLVLRRHIEALIDVRNQHLAAYLERQTS